MDEEDAIATAIVVGLAVWLIVRIINRRERWAAVAFVLLAAVAALAALVNWIDAYYRAIM